MPNPWDMPFLAQEGDIDPERIYAGIGRVSCQWEDLEISLSHLYSCLVGKPHQADAMYDYGDKAAFRARVRILLEPAHQCFRDQDREAQLDQLCEELIGFSCRRNDVAHGVVRPKEFYAGAQALTSKSVVEFPTTYTYWLVPAHYKMEKAGSRELPSYAYNQKLLYELQQNLLRLTHKISSLKHDLFPFKPEVTEGGRLAMSGVRAPDLALTGCTSRT